MLIARTLSSYLARQVLIWCGGVFVVMLSITFLLDYLELIRRGAARPEATLGLLLEMAMLKLPHMAQEVLPFGILFGTMAAFWRLTRTNELVIARAAGFSVEAATVEASASVASNARPITAAAPLRRPFANTHHPLCLPD